jgi:AAT family amino acid transporter
LLTHYKLRKQQGCPPQGKCQLPGFPVTSWLAAAGIVLAIVSMPLIPGQGAGLFAGLGFVALFSCSYLATRWRRRKAAARKAGWQENDRAAIREQLAALQFEAAEEIRPDTQEKSRQKRLNRRQPVQSGPIMGCADSTEQSIRFGEQNR